MLSVVYAKFHYTECRYAECHYTECRDALLRAKVKNYAKKFYRKRHNFDLKSYEIILHLFSERGRPQLDAPPLPGSPVGTTTFSVMTLRIMPISVTTLSKMNWIGTLSIMTLSLSIECGNARYHIFLLIC
jgi:hypothetical protein